MTKPKPASPTQVSHPVIADLVMTVPAADLDDWLAQGWEPAPA